jgi:hypothetical protein
MARITENYNGQPDRTSGGVYPVEEYFLKFLRHTEAVANTPMNDVLQRLVLDALKTGQVVLEARDCYIYDEEGFRLGEKRVFVPCITFINSSEGRLTEDVQETRMSIFYSADGEVYMDIDCWEINAQNQRRRVFGEELLAESSSAQEAGLDKPFVFAYETNSDQMLRNQEVKLALANVLDGSFDDY